MQTIKKLEHLRGNKYDYIIVGAGLAGSVHAQQLANAGYKCLIVEKRKHIAGNIYTEKLGPIDIHKYGSHIAHTDDSDVWKYLQQFTEFNDYKHSVMASTGEETVCLPFSMTTFMQLFNLQNVSDVKDRIASEIDAWKLSNNIDVNLDFEPANFEEQAIVLVGTTVYEKLIKEYTRKQWGRNTTELPAEIIKRLPLRWTTDNTYFNNAKHQGIPVNGYTKMVDNMLTSNNIDIIHCDFIANKSELMTTLAKNGKLIYTGALDELFNYSLGHLEYRSLEFTEIIIDSSNYQGCSVVNYCDTSKQTRITEHKHYSTDKDVLSHESTVISVEYSVNHVPGETTPYYPINDKNNNARHLAYIEVFRKTYPTAILSGRLAMYKYFDMDKVVRQALDSCQQLLR